MQNSADPQAFPHMPQLVALDSRLTQMPLHVVRPGEHWLPPLVPPVENPPVPTKLPDPPVAIVPDPPEPAGGGASELQLVLSTSETARPNSAATEELLNVF